MHHIRSSVLKHIRHRVCSVTSHCVKDGSFLGISRRCMSVESTPVSADLMVRVVEFVKKFDKIDPAKVTEKADFQKDLNLDSLDRVELVMAFETEFNIEIPDEKADRLSCCADVAEYISRETKDISKES